MLQKGAGREAENEREERSEKAGGVAGEISPAQTAAAEFQSILEKFCPLLGAPTPPSVSGSDTDQHRLIPLIVCHMTAALNQSDVIL